MSSDKVQILVVDDDISHCTILQALLRGWGYDHDGVFQRWHGGRGH